MRRSLPLISVIVCSLSRPAAGQNGPITLGGFETVKGTDVEAFERAARSHNQWHRQQGDPWIWAAYQAMTGPTEYVFVSPGHRWADFDSPPLDMAADLAHWAGSGGRHTQTEVFRIWQELPALSNQPADPTAFPVVQVLEFQIRPGGDEEAIWNAVGKYKEAVGEQGNFGWARVVSSEQTPRFFAALWHPNFAALDSPAPDPLTVMAEAHGRAEARAAADAFNANAAVVSTRIWVLRPDLSYMPGN